MKIYSNSDTLDGKDNQMSYNIVAIKIQTNQFSDFRLSENKVIQLPNY